MWGQRIANLNYLSLCFLSCFPLLGMRITVVAIIIFSTLSIVSALVNKNENFSFPPWKELLIFLIPFTLIVIRTWLTDKSEESLFYLEVSLSLLAFPVAYYLSGFGRRSSGKMLPAWLFAISTLAIVLYGQIMVTFNIADHFGPGKTWETYSQMFNDAFFPYQIRTVFEETVVIHPTHASVFLGISILIFLNELFMKNDTLSKGIKILIIIKLALAVVMLAVLASRTPFIATMISGLLLSFFYFRKKVYILYALVSVAALSLFLALLIPSFSERFREISISDARVPTENQENSFNLRTGIYKCSMNTIGKNWLWGVGPGNVQQELNLCYDSISKEVYDEKNYNTHNQFLDYWAGLGIAGPIGLLLVFAWYFLNNFKRRNYLALAIGLLFFLAMLTENLLTRQNGVVPFAFFIGLYFYTSSPQGRRGTIS